MARSLIFKQGGWLSFKGGGRRQIVLTISSVQNPTYNIRTQAGNPVDVVDVLVNVNASCNQGIVTGSGWTSGSTIKLIIAAGVNISGIGGQGGNGATVNPSSETAAQVGQDGGPAITMNYALTIDNAGTIRGGGGGGGGGGAAWGFNPPLDKHPQVGGGGGGGGQDMLGVIGGFPGGEQVVPDTSPGQGQSGTSAGPGNGGTAGSDTGPGDPTPSAQGGAGGNGGAWGTAGSNGQDAAFAPSAFSSVGAAAGAGGFAVKKNGFTLTFINQGTLIGSVA